MDLQLARLRREAGMTQTEAARAVEVSQSTWSGWECGTRQITLVDAARVADMFGVSLDELAGRTPPASTTAESTILQACRESSPEGVNAMVAAVRGIAAAYPSREKARAIA